MVGHDLVLSRPDTGRHDRTCHVFARFCWNPDLLRIRRPGTSDVDHAAVGRGAYDNLVRLAHSDDGFPQPEREFDLAAVCLRRPWPTGSRDPADTDGILHGSGHRLLLSADARVRHDGPSEFRFRV